MLIYQTKPNVCLLLDMFNMIQNCVCVHFMSMPIGFGSASPKVR